VSSAENVLHALTWLLSYRVFVLAYAWICLLVMDDDCHVIYK